jgi:hypothetical protein
VGLGVNPHAKHDAPVEDPELKKWDPETYEKDPVKFAKEILRFTPKRYQTLLLTDESKRIGFIYLIVARE